MSVIPENPLFPKTSVVKFGSFDYIYSFAHLIECLNLGVITDVWYVITEVRYFIKLRTQALWAY